MVWYELNAPAFAEAYCTLLLFEADCSVVGIVLGAPPSTDEVDQIPAMTRNDDRAERRMGVFSGSASVN